VTKYNHICIIKKTEDIIVIGEISMELSEIKRRIEAYQDSLTQIRGSL